VTLVDISRALSQRVAALRFAAPVCCVCNPLEYARAPHELYLSRYASGRKEVLLLDMNPGPFGMVQTGVPFGDVAMVRDWLGVVGAVERPRDEHPKRPVLGFECRRSEVSGARLWGWARARFGTPQRFFERFFVANYCPLALMEDGGANRTPDKLTAAEQKALCGACDDALRDVVRTGAVEQRGVDSHQERGRAHEIASIPPDLDRRNFIAVRREHGCGSGAGHARGPAGHRVAGRHEQQRIVIADSHFKGPVGANDQGA
jgi:single-strand selective monofunctional uracil DNA glycosylase